jgi:hypothetical protein
MFKTGRSLFFVLGDNQVANGGAKPQYVSIISVYLLIHHSPDDFDPIDLIDRNAPIETK